MKTGAKLMSNQFEFEENKYTILTSTVPFKLKNEDEEINYVFPGYGSNQEHLLLQDVHITCIIDGYINELNCLKKDPRYEKSLLKNISHNENIDLLHYFTSKTFSEINNAGVLEHANALHQDPSITQYPMYPNATDDKFTRVVLPLSYWTERNTGICRHINMLLFLLVGHAVANNFISAGNVFAIQSEMFLLGDAHVIVGYQETIDNEPNGNFWILDFVSNEKRVFNIGNIEDHTGIYDLMACYGYDKSCMKNNPDKHEGAAFYVLDIMARYNLPINLSILFEEIEEDGLVNFFDMARKSINKSMIPTYFTWIMKNVYTTSPNDIHAQQIFMTMKLILNKYSDLKENDESKPENEQVLKKLDKDTLALHLVTVKKKLGEDVDHRAKPNRLTPPGLFKMVV